MNHFFFLFNFQFISDFFCLAYTKAMCMEKRERNVSFDLTLNQLLILKILK